MKTPLANPIIETILGQQAMPSASTCWQSLPMVLGAHLALVAFTAIASAAEIEPSPKLSPEDVVQLQMSALSAPGPVPARINRCYRFASPANRQHTGPENRFAGMIQSPKYSVLLDAKHFLVGRATQNGRQAHLLLTVVDSNGNLSLFRCLLSRQTAAPYADCWMTDAVIRIGEVDAAKIPQNPSLQQAPTI